MVTAPILTLEPREGCIAIDLDRLIAGRLLIQANSGGGKSYALRYILEQTRGKVQQIILDPEGEFGSLREKFDYLLVGKDGDLPTDPKTAKILCRRIMELGASAVIDLYDLRPDERKSFVQLFLDELMHLPRPLWRSLLVAIDEAHTFCPEKGSGEACSSASVIQLATQGRKRGYALCAATQRLAKLHKDCAAELLNKLIGRTGLDTDLRRAADELGFSKADWERLKFLDEGGFFAFGPAISKEVVLVRTGEIETTHPRPGVVAPPKPPAPDRILKMVGELGDLSAKAAEEVRDIDSAKRELARLEGELRKARRAPEQADLDAAMAPLKARVLELEGTLTDRDHIISEQTRRIDALESLWNGAKETIDEIVRLGQSLGSRFAFADAQVEESYRAKPESTPGRPVATRSRLQAIAIPKPVTVTSEGLSKPQQRILDALAEFEAIGMMEIDKSVLAMFSDASPRSSAYSNNLGALRSQHGLIGYPAPGKVALTEAGRELAAVVASPRGLEEYQDAWLLKVSAPQGRILTVLINAYPDAVPKIDLANLTDQSPTSSAYSNNLGFLRGSLGLIDYPSQGLVVATKRLFPEGLR